jgi:uncharacterized protein (TIGR00730 family)
MANICVFCSACDNINEIYKRSAEELGELLGKGNHTLIYGGSRLGLMGILAKSVQENGGKVIGIIPEHLHQLAEGENELIKAKNMHHRKELMELKSDAFISLPGGIGTLDETFEILIGLHLKIHKKPITLVNINNYYDDLIKQLNKINKEGFTKPNFDTENFEKLFHVSNSPKEALDYVSHNI